MPERTVQIVNKNGLHARPAAEIVKLAAKFQIPQRDVLHLLKLEMRKIRAAAAEEADRAGRSMPTTIEDEAA